MQVEQGGQHAADLFRPNPGRVFDPGLIVRHRLCVASEAFQPRPVSHPGGEQRRGRADADILQGAADAVLLEACVDLRRIQFNRLHRTHQQHLVEFAGPQGRVRVHVEEAAHQ
ncbi:hypothetical protein D3C76_1518400 [compost metagenome]